MTEPIAFAHLGKHGRLGNALFQLAATAGVAFSRGTEPVFNADWCHRFAFSVPDKYFAKYPRGIKLHECPELAHIDERVRMYAQDYNLFSEHMSAIRAWLHPSEAALARLAEGLTSVRMGRGTTTVLHVRRTDKQPGVGGENGRMHRLAPLEYYREALRVLDADPETTVAFGDDPDWVEAHLGDMVGYVHRGTPAPKETDPEFGRVPPTDWIDLQLMAHLAYGRGGQMVVTGSTFGIWAALLGQPKRVVRPKRVYGPQLRFIDENLLFPERWEVLDR